MPGTSPTSAQPTAQSTAQTSADRIDALLRDHPLVDGHNDLPWAMRSKAGYDFDALDIAEPQARTHTDLPRLREGRVGAQFWSVWVPSGLQGETAVTATLEQVDAVHQMVARYADRLGFARTADEVQQVFDSGRIASLMGAEGGHSIGCSLATLRMLHVLGVRYLTLTHNDNVPWADSATDEPVHHGLSPFGVEVVREMNRIGMLVDLSHVSADTMKAALSVTTVPAMFSHSSARALWVLPRNEGVCMVTFVPDFVSPDASAWRETAAAAATTQGVKATDLAAFTAFTDVWKREHPKPKATLDHVVAHIEHVREVAGVDHVGIGGDYDGVDELPLGLEDVSGYPRLFAALADRGWSDADLAKLAGANVLRVMRAAEAGARELQATRGPSLATYEQLDGAHAPAAAPPRGS